MRVRRKECYRIMGHPYKIEYFGGEKKEADPLLLKHVLRFIKLKKF